MSVKWVAILTIMLLGCYYVQGSCDKHKGTIMPRCNLDYCTERKMSCPVCSFCKKAKDGVYRCHRVNKDHVKNNNDIKAYIANNEGCVLPMRDTDPSPYRWAPTVGYGFRMKPGAFAEALPDMDYDLVRRGRVTLTKEQAWTLHSTYVDRLIETAKRRLGRELYGTLPWNVRAAIVDGYFQEMIGVGTQNPIKQGDWKGAAEKYLKKKRTVNPPSEWVMHRMDCNAWQFTSLVRGMHHTQCGHK